MKKILLISSSKGLEFDADFLQSIAYASQDLLDFKGKIELNLVTNEEIRELNREHRNKDYATDVLSWAFQEAPVQFEHELIGEIYLSLDKVSEQAKEKGHSYEYELAYIFAHGILHLLGYDHQTDEEEAIMNTKTEQIVEKALTKEAN